MNNKGVFVAKKKSGEEYYRASCTFKNKHISLGSFDTVEDASKAYEEALDIINKKDINIFDFNDSYSISFEKFVVLINFRDNNMYLSNPIYIRKNYFSYYLSKNEELKFSIDDLFYYMSHKILRRGGHMYVNDFGMQINLYSRYGIKNYAVLDKDYSFVNGDKFDFRYENIEVFNKYNGVDLVNHKGKLLYKSKIHVNGDLVIGYYGDAISAAIAYNKAIDVLRNNGIDKQFSPNYIDEIPAKVYADIYTSIKLAKNILNRANI